MGEWQPIETAPKDGTRIIGANATHFAAFYYDHPDWADHAQWWQDGCSAFAGEHERVDPEGDGYFFEPTHWRELYPPSPTGAKDNG